MTKPLLALILRRPLLLTRWAGMLALVVILTSLAGRAVAQGTAPPPAPADATAPAATDANAGSAPAGSGDGSRVTLKQLFLQSFDFFTVLLVIGSLAGWTIIIVCIIEVRKANITPEEPERIISGLARSGRWADLRAFVSEDDAFLSRVVRAAMNTPGDDKGAIREAGEMAASEEVSRWFRKVEPLNIIGNLGPLLGLAGTVWGMIIAFAALGQSGGQASPANLSLGISKALFHTLLGLLLAVPCLTVFGFYRSFIDRLCTRAMVVAAEMVELLPADPRARLGTGPRPAGVAGVGAPNGPRPAQAPSVTPPRVGP